MRILMLTSPYVCSMACNLADGLLDLGHEVYNTQGSLNYGERAPDGSLYDLYLMADTDNHVAISQLRHTRPGPRIVIHTHDMWTDYKNAPNSPVKTIPYAGIDCDIMFVRDLDLLSLPPKLSYPVYPLDYSIERRYTTTCSQFLGLVERQNRIVFYGSLGTAQREIYLQKMKNAGLQVEYDTYRFTKPDINWHRWIHGRYTHDREYYRELCKSLFAFVPTGAGPSTMRLGEAYAAGCIPVIQRYPNSIMPMHDFKDGENCILWSTGDELVSKVTDWTNHNSEAEALRERCEAYGQQHLLTRHIAQWMLDQIFELSNKEREPWL